MMNVNDDNDGGNEAVALQKTNHHIVRRATCQTRTNTIVAESSHRFSRISSPLLIVDFLKRSTSHRQILRNELLHRIFFSDLPISITLLSAFLN